MFLSIDFEDFAHDLKRDLGLWKTGPLRVDALWRGYRAIADFLAEHGGALGGTKATFFCTGIIAEQAPDLIAQIAADGHEVACHFHYHDCLDRLPLADVEAQFLRAKSALSAASGQPVHGFRAPKFRIDTSRPDQYRLVERLFRYDSSFCGASQAELAAFRTRMGLTRLQVLPIYRGRVAPGLPPLRFGGSYLKLFPVAVGRRLMRDCASGGLVPHIYLHPYEFLTGGDFMLTPDELAPLGARRAAYWGLRQRQWHQFGNAGLPVKLAALAGGRLGGRLIDALEADPSRI